MKRKKEKEMKSDKRKNGKVGESRFMANVVLGKGVEVQVEFSIPKNETDLTWDEVFDSAVEKANERFLESDFPHMEIGDMFILTDEGKFPVYGEDVDKNSVPKGVKKYLVLPYARYSLSPELALYLKMKESGMANFDFDAGTMREILAMATDASRDS